MGFNTIYEESSVDLNHLRTFGLKKVKLSKTKPRTFLSLSSYIRSHGTVDEMMTAMKLMQEGFSADIIFDMMYKIKSDNNLGNEFTGMKLEEFLKEE